MSRAGRHGYVSALDASCGQGWEEGMLNGKQLKCYLTTSIERLCNERERDHLVAVLKRYDEDSAAFSRKMMAAAFGSIADARSDGVKLGLAASRMEEEIARNPGSPEALEAAKEVESLASGIMHGPNKLIASAKNSEPEYKLINHVKALMIEGYISKDDFGWSSVSLVKKAHREIVDDKITVRDACG